MDKNVSRRAPRGLQDVLNRLAVAAVFNKPICFYRCFAETLESDVVHRTLLEIQAEHCKFIEICLFMKCFLDRRLGLF